MVNRLEGDRQHYQSFLVYMPLKYPRFPNTSSLCAKWNLDLTYLAMYLSTVQQCNGRTFSLVTLPVLLFEGKGLEKDDTKRLAIFP